MTAVTRKVQTERFMKEQAKAERILEKTDIEKAAQEFAEDLLTKGAKPEELIMAANAILDKVIFLQRQQKEAVEEQKALDAARPQHLTMVKKE